MCNSAIQESYWQKESPHNKHVLLPYLYVYFGQGLSWSKTLNDTNHFVGPRPEMNHEKYLLDDNGNKVDQLNVAIGDTVDYYLSGFNNTGNIPAFNSVVVDTLPDNFNLQKLTIELDLIAIDRIMFLH